MKVASVRYPSILRRSRWAHPREHVRLDSYVSRLSFAAAAARRGAAVVEFALVLPLLMLLLMGAIDVGRGIAVSHTLLEAARAGCRLYAVKTEATEQDVRDIVEMVMSEANIEGYTIAFDPAPSVDPAHLSPVTVSVSVPYDVVSWSPQSWFLAGRTLTGTCTMPTDTGENYEAGSNPPPPDGNGGRCGR